MVLISEDQFEVVVPFFLFVAAHVEVGSGAAIDRFFAFVDAVVGNGGRDFKPAFFVEGGYAFFAGPHHGDPVFVNFENFVFWYGRSLPPLLLLEPRFSAGFSGRVIHWFQYTLVWLLSTTVEVNVGNVCLGFNVFLMREEQH